MAKNGKVKASDHEQYTLLTVISVLVPYVGVILGIVYIVKDREIDRKLGEHLISFSILLSILYTIMGIFLLGSLPL